MSGSKEAPPTNSLGEIQNRGQLYFPYQGPMKRPQNEVASQGEALYSPCGPVKKRVQRERLSQGSRTQFHSIG